mmetsp:Transcript_24434/g.56628  ORF Transcript_24434/g.56628 Transcript_24434/m.56628 type:complete len:340 (-) Transcript_24434:148-1167(-)
MLLVSLTLLWCGFAAEWPIPADEHDLQGLHAFVRWPDTSDTLRTVLLLFHGCNGRGSDWFRLPEEVRFLRAAIARGIALVSFTRPPTQSTAENFCWPSHGTDFEDAVDLVQDGVRRVLRSKTSHRPRLVFLGASSGGLFVSRMLNAWLNKWKEVGQVAAFLSVVSPTSLVRSAELVEEPREGFPASAFVYMPRDQTFASEAAIKTVVRSLQRVGVPAKVWPVAPRALTAQNLTEQLECGGVYLQEFAASRFIEALTDLGLVEAGEVLEDPRKFPWQRALGLLKEIQPESDKEHRRRCVEELLNRAWAQHEFGLTEIEEEVLDWLADVDTPLEVSNKQEL